MDDGSGNAGLFFFLFFIHLVLCACVGSAAKAKGRSAAAFFTISFLVSPLIGAILVGVMSKDHVELDKRAHKDALRRNPDAYGQADPALLAKQERMALLSDEYRKCPSCAEVIRREAIKCRFCGENLER